MNALGHLKIFTVGKRLFESKLFENAITIQQPSSHLVLPNNEQTHDSGYLSDFTGL